MGLISRLDIVEIDCVGTKNYAIRKRTLWFFYSYKVLSDIETSFMKRNERYFIATCLTTSIDMIINQYLRLTKSHKEKVIDITEFEEVMYGGKK